MTNLLIEMSILVHSTAKWDSKDALQIIVEVHQFLQTSLWSVDYFNCSRFGMPIQFGCSLLPVLASFCVQYSYYSSIIPWNEQHPNKSWMILSKASHNGELNELFRKLKCNHVIIIIIWIIFPNFICLYINVFSKVIRIRLPTRG